jgi:hypothetical protein
MIPKSGNRFSGKIMRKQGILDHGTKATAQKMMRTTAVGPLKGLAKPMVWLQKQG